MPKVIFSVLAIIVFTTRSYAQLIASAGNNKTICYNTNTSIGGSPSASGGTAPYTYDWQPTTFLNSNTVSNPSVTGCTEDMFYTLTVTDKDGNTATSIIQINIDKIYTYNAGIDTGYCYGQSSGVQIGSANNNGTFHTFNWSPSLGLDDASAPNPIATPTITTVYQLTVSDGLCPSNVTQITVIPFQPPYVDAGIDTTIDEGNIITLNGSAANTYFWTPDINIRYTTTKNPDVWPITNTVYTLTVSDSHHCYNSDTVRVNVRNGDILFFYNTFTPNHDNDNDFFFIGNIEKYPDNVLKIYNRYGKLIYSASSYFNTWDGTYLGNEVPTGTYFYTLYDGKEKTYKGTVTIMR